MEIQYVETTLTARGFWTVEAFWQGTAIYRHALKIGHFRHMPPCTHELRPTRWHHLECTMEFELEERVGPDAETFRMRQRQPAT